MVSAALVEIVEAAVTAKTVVVVDAVAEDEFADPIVDPAAQVAAATVAVVVAVDQAWNSVNQTAHSDSRHYY